MPTELSSFRIDSKIKKEAQILAREMGTNLSNIINMYLAQFVKEKRIHFIKSTSQDSYSVDSGKSNTPIVPSTPIVPNAPILPNAPIVPKTTITDSRPHVQAALRKMEERRQGLPNKQDFGNQVKSEGIPTEDVYIFYSTKEEDKFFRINNSFHKEIPEEYFFFYEFTKSEHQITGIPNNLILTIDVHLKKDELLSTFKTYIEKNRESIGIKHYFGYSRFILDDKQKKMFDAIREFFEDQNNYILFKVQNLANGEQVVLRAENHWLLKEEFFENKSNDSIRQLFHSDDLNDYGRYAIYSRKSGHDDGIFFEVLTGKYIPFGNEVIDLMRKAKKDLNLDEFNLIEG